ncbi:hypothetical protein ASE05_16045 [Mesorhizobium sp. Root172]|nr:hypothetical protein ASE05_16045 [Mesorhizobium sp. Root172]
MSIDLPWPPRALHPNARVHYMRKARVAKFARDAAGWAVLKAGIRRNDPDITPAMRVTVTFSPPDRRDRDRDNLLANCKAYFDGISDVLGVNDSKWDFTTRAGDIVKHGAVRIELEAAQ